MNETGIIILAAGNSSRLGKNKQLLFYKEKTLLQHIIDEALNASLQPVVVVTGANREQISEAINRQPIHVVNNKNWQEGMASAIVVGLLAISSINKNKEDIIIAVCDQPFVSSTLFLRLCDKRKESNKGIVACSYANTTGTPVLFTPAYFEELLQLSGEGGAKKIIARHPDDVETVFFPKGNIDIDTEDDYLSLLHNP